MWSKEVLIDQALSIGSNIFSGEQMYQKVQKVFWENNFIPSISRAYAGHIHISFNILHYGGDIKNLRERQGTSFGIWKQFMTTPKGDGMVMAPDTMVEGESSQGQVIADHERWVLRYDSPDLGMLGNVHPNLYMKLFLREQMEFEQTKDDFMTAW